MLKRTAEKDAAAVSWRSGIEQATYLFMRFVTGLVFWAHGLAKLKKGIGPVGESFVGYGLPEWLVYPVLAVELIGGMALILGVATRYAAWALAVIMVGAILTVKWQNGLMGSAGKSGYELDLVLLAITLYLGGRRKRTFIKRWPK
ncbi:DoxX family protein [Brevibacillus borstelensis]|uniref:DoxX family protein n=1 Tax=Brevibacillus borstelensis TaxID=45462 RepID=UPI0030C0687F